MCVTRCSVAVTHSVSVFIFAVSHSYNINMHSLSLFIFLSVCCLTVKSQPLITQNDSKLRGGQKLQVPSQVLQNSQETKNRIKLKYDSNDKKSYEDALKEREKFQEQYRDKVGQWNKIKNIKIPKRPHLDGRIEHKDKKRLLRSTNNQFPNIDEGNSDQVTDLSFVYSLRNSKLFIHKVSGAALTEFYTKSFDWPLFPRQIHASQGYFAIIFQLYRPNATVIKVYHNSGSSVTEIREFKKQGVYIASREYNNYLLVLVQQQMKSPNLDYTWTVSGMGDVKEQVFEGISANKTAKNNGNAARSFAKIPLGPLENTNFKFSTFLLCDFAWDIILTEQLHVYVAGNYYNSSDYAVSIQTFDFNQKNGSAWGTSRWAILPGLINNNYQMHEFNNYFRVVLLYVDGDWGTPGHVAAAKIPLTSFDPSGGLYRNLGTDGSFFTASRFVMDYVFLVFQDGSIKTFSTSVGVVRDTLKIKQKVFQLYPYGPNFLVGFGTTESGNDVAITIFQSTGCKLTLKQSLSLKSSKFSYSSYGWFSNQFLQFDWATKRITFPVFSSEDQPYKSGYYQVYSNPFENCLSSLPVLNPCPNNESMEAPVVGKLFKHWDNAQNYDWRSGPSEQIRRSSTLISEGKYVLITGSSCQLQARIIKPPGETPVFSSTNTSDFTFVDLCT